MYRRRRHSRALLIARNFPSLDDTFSCMNGKEGSALDFIAFAQYYDISGGYSGRVPPLPIPNREVKPARADGTAHPWESR